MYADQQDFALVADALKSIALQQKQKVGDFYLLGIPDLAKNSVKNKWMFSYLVAVDRFRSESGIFTIQRNTHYDSNPLDQATELQKVKGRFEILRGRSGLCEILKCTKSQKKLPFPYSK